MRGFFGIGVQEISKAQNLGNLLRSAHSFGASFFFTINRTVDMRGIRQSDTSGAADHMPFYDFPSVESLVLPRKCALVGVELTEDAIELPSFKHPQSAAYVLGPEMGSLSDDLIVRCDHIVKIPMKFCVNVGTAGAILMYDRMISTKRFPARPPKSGGPVEDLPETQYGPRRISSRRIEEEAADMMADHKS